MSPKTTIGSLFSGMCGFELAFQRAGMNTLWSVEIEPSGQKVVEKHFPESKHWPDVTTFNPSDFECPSTITFGSPCQDLSVAGKRSGINGERSGLFYHATRIIREFVGRGLEFALWENVPGCLNSNGPRDFAAVLGELGKCGAMDIAWGVLDAQWFGLAQRRKRVFLVADFRGERAAEILSLTESLCGNPAPSREAGKRVAHTIEGRAGRSGSNNFATSGGLAEVSPALKARDCKGPSSDGDGDGDGAPLIPCTTHTLSSEGADASEDGTGRGTPLVPVTARPLGSHHRRDDLDNDPYVASITPIQSVNMVQEKKQNGIGIGKPGDEMFTLTGRDQHAIAFDTTQVTSDKNRSNPKDGDPCHPLASNAHPPAIAFSCKDYGNGAADDLSPTLRAMPHDKSHSNGGGQMAIAFKPNKGSKSRSLGESEHVSPTLESTTGGNNKPAVMTSMQVRRLTPTECLRLQGFPDDYFDGLGFSDSTKYRMIGNSVAVPVVEWIAHRIAKELRCQPPTRMRMSNR